MQLNSIGRITQKCWEDIPQHYAGIDNDIFVVMPNHVHGIILIQGENRRSGSKPAPTIVHPLTEIVRAFKTFSSRGINEHRNSPGIRIWQHSYYEHIIRSEKEYREIAEYVMYNPAKWQNDDNNIFGSKKSVL
jgi:putative transposase